MTNNTHQPEGTRRQIASRYLTMYYTRKRLAPVDIPTKRRNSAEINFISVKETLLLYKQQFTKCFHVQC